MNEQFFYHVVSGRTWQKGEHIFFDSQNGIHDAVYNFGRLKKVSGLFKSDKIIDEYDFIVRELAAEEVRKNEYPDCPSRLKCIYICDKADDADAYARRLKKHKKTPTQLVKLLLRNGKLLCVDPNVIRKARLSYNEYKDKAREFFKGAPTDKFHVFMFEGEVEIAEIVKTY